MNRNEIEARLERSLRNQVTAPRLDERFDSAVWARIEASSARATNPGVDLLLGRPSKASRWLAFSNGVGFLVAIAVSLYFGLRALGPSDIGSIAQGFDRISPVMTEAMATQVLGVLGYVLSAVVLILGLSLTSYGRRLRATFG